MLDIAQARMLCFVYACRALRRNDSHRKLWVLFTDDPASSLENLALHLVHFQNDLIGHLKLIERLIWEARQSLPHGGWQPTKRRRLEIAAERLSQCRLIIHTEGPHQCC